jgi:hypothetical protein
MNEISDGCGCAENELVNYDKYIVAVEQLALDKARED